MRRWSARWKRKHDRTHFIHDRPCQKGRTGGHRRGAGGRRRPGQGRPGHPGGPGRCTRIRAPGHVLRSGRGLPVPDGAL
ncbi:MAG TPA: hypothetical protein DIU32_03405 [Oscillibacter sp.]|nr:hypothetical protein [Oscillibacter sp.]